MLTAKKFDVVAVVRDDADLYAKKKIEATTTKTVDWEQEQREQEFKQALLEGRVARQDQRQFLNLFKVKVWMG